jgi:hypothetical protein
VQLRFEAHVSGSDRRCLPTSVVGGRHIVLTVTANLMLEILTQANPVVVGVLAGSLPTVSMLLCSLMAVSFKFTSTFESSAQNYCAGKLPSVTIVVGLLVDSFSTGFTGLILGAVAKELFPQIDTDSKHDNLLGITIGFFVGCFFVNYLDYFVTSLENVLSWAMATNGVENSPSLDAAEQLESQQMLNHIAPQHASYNSLDSSLFRFSSNVSTNGEMSDAGSVEDGDEPLIMLAAQATASPVHRQRIRSKIIELVDSIVSMERKSRALHGYVRNNMPHSEAELYADHIDEDIHRFQYLLDNCRRYRPRARRRYIYFYNRSLFLVLM